ncbi:MAG: hypothetical protein ACT4QD_11420 [Acidobacteriota bacterium]
MQGFGQFMKAVGVAVVMASLLHGLRSGTTPGTALHAVGEVGFHLTVVFTVALILAPPAGSLLIITIAEGFRRTCRADTVLRAAIALKRLCWLLLVVSVWLPVHAYANLQWPGWRIAYVYAGVAGAILGGLSMASTITADVRQRVARI